MLFYEDRKAELLCNDLCLFRTGDLGAHDGLIEAQLAIKFRGSSGGGGEVNYRVDGFRLLLNVVGKAATAPDVNVLDGSTIVTSRNLPRVGSTVRSSTSGSISTINS